MLEERFTFDSLEMTYPTPQKLSLPIQPYKVGGYKFRDRVRRKIILWATHLGDDVEGMAGTEVRAVGDGEVVWAEMRLGSRKRRNWGGVVVVAHNNKFQIPNTKDQTKEWDQMPNTKFQTFFSVYGHMRDLRVAAGDQVAGGQVLGVVAEGETPANGWWKIPHLHFGIYVGPWRDVVLPGYKRIEEVRRTKVKWWRDPRSFIEQYNEGAG